MVGDRFGRLTVVSYAGGGAGRGRHWLCRCDCGQEKEIRQTNLLSGNSTSCGCRVREPGHGPVRHGMSHEPIHAVWRSMLARCRNPKSPAYRNYGGRGIEICDRWLVFELFLADMGLPPKGMTLERMDNFKGYGPANCRWATRTDQGRNKRSNLRLTIGGRTQTLSEWAEERGLDRRTIQSRLRRGWPTHLLLSPPMTGGVN